MNTTIKEREKEKRFWLKVAKAEVKRRNWSYASDAYRSAAFHAAVLKALRAKP